ncbi:thiol-activated cytolysin family protein [uncultured Alloprevotella sp.]|uniref:thiol-activated cytolysin family protein n=1 Tax=uncultured Alloprevotella sp. TaxID=1283315 RepID=UPI0026161FB4|nr:thiol-activated cytolysin family protein [uncultured Alloprevotella sp.]
MKKLINKVSGYCCLALLFPLLAACSSDSPSGPYKELKQVNFPQEKSTVLETIPTGRVVDGYNQLLEVYTVQEVLDPISTIERTSYGVYPGKLLNGEDFMKANLTEVSRATPYSSFTFTLQLPANKYDKIQLLTPNDRDLDDSLRVILQAKAGDIYKENEAMNYIDLFATDVTTAESCNQVFNKFCSRIALDSWLKRVFGLDERLYRAYGPHYVALKVRQKFFSVSLQPVRPADWGTVKKDLGAYEPLYVSDVDYGRELNLVARTDMSAEQFKDLFQKALQASMDPKSGGKYDQEMDRLNQMLKERKISVVINQSKKNPYSDIPNCQSLLDFLKMPSAVEFLEYCVPIAYKVKAVRDNRPIVVRAIRSEQRLIKGEKAK